MRFPAVSALATPADQDAVRAVPAMSPRPHQYLDGGCSQMHATKSGVPTAGASAVAEPPCYWCPVALRR